MPSRSRASSMIGRSLAACAISQSVFGFTDVSAIFPTPLFEALVFPALQTIETAPLVHGQPQTVPKSAWAQQWANDAAPAQGQAPSGQPGEGFGGSAPPPPGGA